MNLTENVWRNRRSIELIAEGLRPAQPLEFEVQAASGQRLRRGPPPMPAQQVRSPSEVPSGGDGPLWLTALPLADDPLEGFVGGDRRWSSVTSRCTSTSTPKRWLTRGPRPRLPHARDVRRAFVGLRREQPPAFSETKNALVRQVLTELDLLDALGRVRSGQKRDPYSSDVLVTGPPRTLPASHLCQRLPTPRRRGVRAGGAGPLSSSRGAPEGGQGAVRY